MDHSLHEAQVAYAAASRSDGGATDGLTERLARGSLAERTWAIAIRGSRWLAGFAGGAPPPPSWRSESLTLDGPAVVPASAAWCDLAWASFVSQDVAGVETSNEALETLASRDPTGKARLRSSLIDAALSVLRDGEADVERVVELATVASRLQLADLVVAATTLRALVESSLGDPSSALAAARRASRMSRTEAIVYTDYLANIVLARCRRISGHPVLAARILASIGRVAPAHFHAWVAWEHTLAGELPDASSPSGIPSAEAPRRLLAVVEAAGRGDPEAFVESVRALDAATERLSLLRRDADVLLDTIDATREPGELARAWCEGRAHETPLGLHALAATAADPVDAGTPATSYAVRAPGGAGRRVLALGVPLLDGTPVAASKRRHTRLDTATASLLLAPSEGLSTREWFERVYGFPYHPEKHKGVIDTLTHRLRAHLADTAEVLRRDGHLVLLHDRSIVVPDPRCEAPLQDRILLTLARHTRLSAADASKTVGVPLRTLQAALKTLVSEGACKVVREGKQVTYEVEDTTFSEPTHMRRT